MRSPGERPRFRSVEEAVAAAIAETREPRSTKRNLLVILVIVAAVLVARQTGFFGEPYKPPPMAEVNLKQFDADLAALPLLPRLGNPSGSQHVVTFFDYRCETCRHLAHVLHDTLVRDPNLELKLVELPLLGPESELAARYALAAALQGDYGPFYRALMFSTVSYTDSDLASLGTALGLDGARLTRDAHGAQVDAALRADRRLAAKYGIDQAPTVLIGKHLILGRIDRSSLLGLLEAVRSGS